MNKSKALKEVFEWAEMLTVSVCVVLLLMTVVVRHSPVTGHSMYPTLVGSAVGVEDQWAAEKGQNDLLIISDLLYTPKSGDIVVTQADYHMDSPLVKRVIAVGGQTLKIDFVTWDVWVDGVKLDQSYVNREDTLMDSGNYKYYMDIRCEIAEDGSYIIPDGYIFCMGDNRNHSSDSRLAAIGLIDERLVVGKVIFRIYPFDRIGVVK